MALQDYTNQSNLPPTRGIPGQERRWALPTTPTTQPTLPQTGTTPSYLTGAQSPAQSMQETLETFLDPNSSYIQNARQRGVEMAASRGGLNSSIAAGAAERAAIEAVQPFVQQATAQQTERERVEAQNWLDQQGFDREFQGQLALMPIQNSYEMLNMLQQYSLQDPALFTPEVVSGYSNFFNNNMKNIMDGYFKGLPGVTA